MIKSASDHATKNGIARLGSQPIALAAAILVIVVIGVGAVVGWRLSTGISPEQERVAATRLLQARTAQASEQLVEKTKALEVSQQEQVDQLQVVQDQLLTLKRLIAGQQSDAKRLSDQVAGLTSSIDNLRQSFASAQQPDPPAPAASRRSASRSKGHTARVPQRKRTKAHG